MSRFRKHAAGALAAAAIVACAPSAAAPVPTPTTQPPPRDSAAGAGPQRPGQAQTGPRPYDQVVTRRARTDSGVVIVHTVDDKFLFEIPLALMGRDLLLVTRIAGVAPGMGGFLPAGVSINEQVVRWEHRGDRVLVRKYSFDAVADDSLPIARSVVANNFAPILGAFPIRAWNRDSTAIVVDVTDFFQGDTPAIGGLSAAQRRNYQVRRLDPARSLITRMSSYPENVEVRHLQTFEAGAPPGDGATGTISLELAQSMVLLPREPMRPRYADARVGFLSVEQVNYGLDEQKAATQVLIRRWRLEPKDPAAYARGELVEPVKPIVYYIDPATPAKWRPWVRKGIEDWQPAFETAGFRNAIVARDAPSAAEDPDWDPEDIRYSVVRWAASLTRNAQGPSTSDPRTGEIIESDIVWYHNHMRSYRNRLLIETGAANPAARTLRIPETLMGETMRQVIAHEIGHAIGLPHNMAASSAYPVDSLRNPGFARRMGVSPSVMDYARQNYVAQPGDGLEPLDFIRHIGPYDHYVINWGYRVLPQASTAEAEVPTLRRWILEKADDPQYRYLPQGVGSDPGSQMEDMGDDPVKASSYAIANLKRVVPNLVAWTSTPGDSYDELEELYGELLGQWGTYVRHVVTLLGGQHQVTKSTDQPGPVYQPVASAKQKDAMAWLGREVFEAPIWLNEPAILARVGQTGTSERFVRGLVGILNQVLDPRRLARVAEAEALFPGVGYPLAEFFDDLGRAVWRDPRAARAVDGYRRALQRAYLERAEFLMTQELPTPPPNPFFNPGPPPSLARSDVRPLLRAQLVELRVQAVQGARGGADRITRTHWADVAERIVAILGGPGR